MGVKDTVDAVRETEKKGIAVIGMYIGPESPIPRLIYKNLIILGAGNLPPVIARILKKIITQS
jgi:nitric oxide reductase activation protein